MPGVRAVHVHDRPLTRERLYELVGEDIWLCPLQFDVARQLSVANAQALHAWLRRRRIDAVIVGPGAAASERATHSFRSMGARPERD